MPQITDIITEAQYELTKEIEISRSRRVFIDSKLLSQENFGKLLQIECNKVLIARNSEALWIIDKLNRNVIFQLYLYLTGDKEFTGSLSKGILMAGKIGSGKTVLLKGFCGVIEKLSNKIISKYHAIQMTSIIRKDGIENFVKKSIFIDDLGKEDEVVKDYGTDVRPMLELFSLRYDIGSWTFATTNYKEKTLSEKYGEQTTERFREMFNLIELPGDSRRK